MIRCRCESELSEEIKGKISLFCNVPQDAVIDEKEVENSIYEVPLDLHRQVLDVKICKALGLTSTTPDLTKWKQMLHSVLHPPGKVVVGIVGKYMDHQDAYKSVFEALHHGASAAGCDI
jgi:CTP synthase